MSDREKILVIHGPNLHLLGTREPGIYGSFTLDDLKILLEEKAYNLGVEVENYQSNSEGDIVDKITAADYDFLVINPAAYTHTSVAIRDALLGIKKPTIEVHISNIYSREEFRKNSLISDTVIGVISGLGKHSYLLALDAATTFLSEAKNK
jgi:3-dehydroquinate dehydratase II